MYVRKLDRIIYMSQDEYDKAYKINSEGIRNCRYSENLADLIDVIVARNRYLLRPYIVDKKVSEFLDSYKTNYEIIQKQKKFIREDLDVSSSGNRVKLLTNYYGAILNDLGIIYVARVYEDGSLLLIDKED